MKKFTFLYLMAIPIAIILFLIFSIVFILKGCHQEEIIAKEEDHNNLIIEEYSSEKIIIETSSPKEETTIIDEKPSLIEKKPVRIDYGNDQVNIYEEYSYASQVWDYLKLCGWNDYVCAGIMGNLMRETGGDTLKLNPYLYDSTGQYYGICQWSAKYCPAVQGVSLEKQLDYLKSTIEKEFNTFGGKYSSGFTYWHFTQITDEREAAVAFAACYERCSTGGNRYLKRQNNATIAYKYFVG